jgi:hypothetical protein
MTHRNRRIIIVRGILRKDPDAKLLAQALISLARQEQAAQKQIARDGEVSQ